MIRLYILVEGQTEEQFAKTLLVPHLRERAITAIPIIVTTSRESGGRKRKGGGKWKHWRDDLLRLSGHDQSGAVRFTTLFDLYGLPGDFPGMDRREAVHDTRQRALTLETLMAEDIHDWRLIPYIQRHEFEALVLASLDALSELVDPLDRHSVESLRVTVKDAGGPEEVNDSEVTAPSKRLEREIQAYEKTTHGPLATEAAGLATIRMQCPRFSAWLDKLEALSEIDRCTS